MSGSERAGAGALTCSSKEAVAEEAREAEGGSGAAASGLAAAAWQLLRGRSIYHDNYFERQARQA